MRQVPLEPVKPGLRRLSRHLRVPEFVWAAAIFLLLSTIFLWQPIFSGRVFLPTDIIYLHDALWRTTAAPPGGVVAQNEILSDVAFYYYPYADYAISRLSTGHFPLWNPYILTGTPFFASAQAAILDPINLLTFLAGPLAYWTWGALLRLTLIGFTMYGFMRAIGRSRAAALASGVVFMTCGFVTVWLNYSVITSLAWLPALLWSVTRLLQTGRGIWAASTALFTGLLLLGGHPEIQFLSGLLVASYTVYCVFATRWQGSGWPAALQRLALVAGAGTLGLGIAAVQVFPFLQLLLSSSVIQERAGPAPIVDLGKSILRLGIMFLPNLSGSMLEKNYWMQSFLNFNEQTAYTGLLATTVACLGAIHWWKRDKLARFFACLALVSIPLVMQAPGFNLIKELPVFNVGYGVRWAAAWSFSGAVLVGFGLDAFLLKADRSRAAGRLVLLWLGVVIVALLTLLALYVGIRDQNWDKAWGSSISHEKITSFFHPAHLTPYWPVIFMAAGAVLAFARWKSLWPNRALAVLLIALLFADLWTFGSTYNPVTLVEAIYPSKTTTNFLQSNLNHERFVSTGGTLRPDAAMLFGLRDLQGYEDLIDQCFRQLQLQVRPALNITGKGDLKLTLAQHRLLQVAGVKYVLTPRKVRVGEDARPYRWLFQEDGLKARIAAYENLEVLPRAFVVLNAEAAPDATAAIRRLLDPGLDPRKTVVLTTSEKIPLTNGTDVTGSAALNWQKDEPEEIQLLVNMPAPGYVVLSDNNADGWQATVDGQSVPILRANVAYRAVQIPTGTHTVRYEYAPPLFFACAALSLLSTTLVLSVAVRHLLRKRFNR